MSERPDDVRQEIAAHLRALADLGITELRVSRSRTPAGSSDSPRTSAPPAGSPAGPAPGPRTGGRTERSEARRTVLQAESPASAAPLEETSGRPGRSQATGPVDAASVPASSTGPSVQDPGTLPGDFLSRDLDADLEIGRPAGDPREALDVLRTDTIGECTRCKLFGKRKTIVFGSGNPRANLMFVGEGPGADEDEQGLPFVGRAGQLLTKMIESMKVGGAPLSRDEVYIANIIKCRPPGNRDPEPDEIEACEAFLFEQIAIVSPRVIVALGAFAARTLLRSRAPISALRGRFHPYRGRLLMPTFHPAYVLRNYTPETRRTVFEDLKKVAAELERAQG